MTGQGGHLADERRLEAPAAASVSRASRALSLLASGRLLPLLALLVAGLCLLYPLAGPGLWDPPELEVAEQSRRIALNLLGAQGLRLEHSVNQVPIRAELGKGELPFTSVALGFKLLGLSDWAGRLPLALWGLLGAVATYALVARLLHRTAACLSVLVLCSTPLYFVQARTLLGDVVSLASLAVAAAGLGVGMLDSRLSKPARAGWLACGALGLYAAFWCRGLLLGVAVPLTSLAICRIAGALRTQERSSSRLFVDVPLIGAALVAWFFGIQSLEAASLGAPYSVLVGASSAHAQYPPAFDSELRLLVHSLFPMSALLPFAFALLLKSGSALDAAAERERGLRHLIAGLIVTALLAHALLAPFSGDLPFVGCFACAVAVGLMLWGIARAELGSRVLAMGVCAIGALLLSDFLERPETVFSAYATFDSAFPAALAETHRRVWAVGTLLFLGVCFFCYFETRHERESGLGWRADYAAYLGALRSAYAGNLWFVLLGLLLLLASFGWLLLLSEGFVHLPSFERMWSLERSFVRHAWWVAPLLIFVVPGVVLGVRDVFRRFGASARAGLASSALCGFGLTLSLYYYPALASELSPKQVFTLYERHAARGEPLGLLGVSNSVAAYYTRAETHFMTTPKEASDWLAGGGRRFLVAKTSDLAELNARFRAQARPLRNLPVLGGGQSEVSLVSNQLAGARSANPYESFLLSKQPKLEEPLQANLSGRLDVIGWEIRTASGEIVDVVLPGRRYRLRIGYRVVGRFVEDWDTFVHIDGFGRRFNADHETFGGQYPMRLLQRGDYVVDEHELVVDPNFTPGDYRFYFGMYRGKQRLPVTRGAHDDDRVEAGVVRIR